MKKYLRALMVVPVAAVLLQLHTTAVQTAAFLPSYSITQLGTLGGSESFAYAINANGDIVGSSRLPGDTLTHSFLYSRGKLTDLSPLNSQELQTVGPTSINSFRQVASGLIAGDGIYYPAVHDAASGITTLLGALGAPTFYQFSGAATAVNDYGQAVGYSYIDGTTYHAFFYTGGAMTDIGSAAGYSSALNLNNLGQVVGFASDAPDGFAHAFVYSAGARTVINPFGTTQNESYALDINDNGQVVGQGITAHGYTGAFAYSAGKSKSLGTLPGGHNSAAYAINEQAQIVGIADYPFKTSCYDPFTGSNVPCIRYAQHAMLYDHGTMIDLNWLVKSNSGWDLQWALDINGRGQIVGYGTQNGVFRAFVMSPSERRTRS